MDQKSNISPKNKSQEVALHIQELQTILQIDLQNNVPQKIKRQIKKYPNINSLKKVIRVGNQYYYEQYRIGVVEIELVEQEDFIDKQKIVKEIRLLIKNFTILHIPHSPWSIAETLVILIVLYDHDIRDQLMQKITITTVEFHNQICKDFNLQRNYEAYSRKIGEVKSLKLTLDDLQLILNYVKANAEQDPQKLNNLRMIKTQLGVKFESKDECIIQWNKIQKKIKIVEPEQQEKLIKSSASKFLIGQPIDSIKDKKTILDEKYLQDISISTGIHITEVRLLWQRCRMNMTKLIEEFQEMLDSGEDEKDSEKDQTIND